MLKAPHLWGFFYDLYTMTILYLYYNQPEAIKHLESLGYHKMNHDVVFVDDGSKEPLECGWATVYRIDEDIKWNQPRANNLGLSMIMPYQNVLRMDIDHYFTVEQLDEIAKMKLNKNEIIHFKRTLNGNKINTHLNTYLARVIDLMNAGAYNEDYCGSYGYDDVELMERLRLKRFKFIMSNLAVKADLRFATDLERDTTINKARFEKSYLHRHHE